MAPIPPYSSLGRSIAANLPYNAPPTFPQTNYIQGNHQLVAVNRFPNTYLGMAGVNGFAGIVNSKNRTYGMSWLYSRGAQVKKWFRMISTGTVESTEFQPITSFTEFNMFNGNLYRCGYPRNLGWSEKVPTIPPAALGTAPWQMAPAPQWKRNIYTKRSFSTAPSIPAKPQNG